MLKSPSSILNSIRKMKSNLRNDKQQLRIIKNNFIYQEQPFQSTKQLNRSQNMKQKEHQVNKDRVELQRVKEQFLEHNIKDGQFNSKNRSKSLLNMMEKTSQNKQNNLNESNQASRVSQLSSKTRHNNKLKIDDHKDNILRDVSGLRRNSLSKAIDERPTARDDKYGMIMSNDQNRKQQLNMKSMRYRFQTQIQSLKQSYEQQKSHLINQMHQKMQTQTHKYETQIQQLKQYIVLLEQQLQQQQQRATHQAKSLLKESDKVDMSVQMTASKESQLKLNNQQTQTDMPYFNITHINQHKLQQLQSQQHFSSIRPSYQSNTPSQFISNFQFISNQSHQYPNEKSITINPNNGTQSHIQSQRSPNQPICKLNSNIYHNELIQQICLQFQQSSPLPSRLQFTSQQQLNIFQREKYQHIINKLLEENTKMHKKIEKIYSSHHHQNSKEINSKEKTSQEKNCFFKNHGISYKTVTSNQVQDSNCNSFSNQQSKVINRYFTSQQNPSLQNSQPNPSNQSQQVSEFTSRVIDPNMDNYLSNRQSSNQIKTKGSIVYRVSNVLSTDRCKEGRNSSRSKIPCKHPPVQIKPFSTQSQMQHLRTKTQACEKPADNDDFNSNHLNSSYKETRNEQSISMRDNSKRDKQFKFYDSQSMKSSEQQKQNKSKSNINWQDESESEILNDEMKLKTIKTFKCFSKE